MSDVFISYARPDEATAVRVAEALRSARFEVWRDDDLPAHRPYADVIAERLSAAKAVVVLWSEHAARSQWVRAEADSARSAGILIQASIDGTVPPLPFNQIQCADLGGWGGEAEAPGWRKLLSSVGALAGARTAPDPASPVRPRRGAVCVCVLPFANMSGEAEQEYFSDGISEDITTDLSRISALSVISRNTAFTFKNRSVNVCDISRDLGVTHVLEGSVRKAGGRVRVTAQLIDGGSGDHVWAERYDRDLDDIFAIQDEISKAIVTALKVKLLPEEKKAIEQRGTLSAEAYNLYLLARQYWVTGNHGDIRREERVMRICGRAVEIDPQYGRAWALLANAQSNLRYTFGTQDDDGFAAANAALSIDPTIAEAHCAMARRLDERGRHDEALAQIETALSLDPDSWEVNKEAARIFAARRRLDDALRHYEMAVLLMESDFHAWAMVATCAREKNDGKRVKQAAEMMVSQSQKALEQDPSNGAALGILAGGLAILGQRERANEMIERALLIDPDNSKMRYNFACVLANYLDEHEEAITLLESTLPFANREMVMRAMVDPDMDPLRGDPRFAAMIESAKKRLGIADSP